ncbi:hypothetical protein BH09BAC1_BH09BAC1_00480 [soil metagenome]
MQSVVEAGHAPLVGLVEVPKQGRTQYYKRGLSLYPKAQVNPAPPIVSCFTEFILRETKGSA